MQQFLNSLVEPITSLLSNLISLINSLMSNNIILFVFGLVLFSSIITFFFSFFLGFLNRKRNLDSYSIEKGGKK